MFRIIGLCIVFCISAVVAYGQETLSGRVFETDTRIALPGVNVQNLNNKQTTVTDNKGQFSISAKLNDVLVFKGFAYQNDTVLITSKREYEIFMLPETHLLKDVKISTFDGKAITTRDPNFHGQSVNYQTDAGGNYKGGVNLRVWSNKASEKKRKHSAETEKEERIQQQIDAIFNPQKLTAYVPLTGAELDNFIALYTPSTDVFQSANFNLTSYISTSYKAFMKMPAEQRLGHTAADQLKKDN